LRRLAHPKETVTTQICLAVSPRVGQMSRDEIRESFFKEGLIRPDETGRFAN